MTRLVPDLALAEAWWPLQSRATDTRWYAEHCACPWWDAGDPMRTRLAHAAALGDELVASLPADVLSPGTRVVELGCGPGATLQELAVRTDCELHAYDGDAAARKAASALVPDARIWATLDDLPACDVVWAPRAFAHDAARWPDMLAAVHRVLKPGGHLVAVVAGPGVWAWSGPPAPWDEDRTGILSRSLEDGSVVTFSSRWWLREHWGRGFDALQLRAAGVAMSTPDHGYGVAVWRRRDGAPLDAAAFAATEPEDIREGLAWKRQVALADVDARTRADRRRATLDALGDRHALLLRPDAVDADPRVRAAAEQVALVEAELAELRTSRWWTAGEPLRAAHERWRSLRT